MFGDMGEYIKEVEKEVNFEDLVNRIYTAEVNEDSRLVLIEKAFTSKDFLDKHSTAVNSLVSNLNQYHYSVARKTIMDLHKLEEPDTKSQHDFHNKIQENLNLVHKPVDPVHEKINSVPQHVKRPKSKDDSYISLEDIPDERFDPPPLQPRNRGAHYDVVPPITPPKREDHDYITGRIPT
jgi:hypothetical protein